MEAVAGQARPLGPTHRAIGELALKCGAQVPVALSARVRTGRIAPRGHDETAPRTVPFVFHVERRTVVLQRHLARRISRRAGRMPVFGCARATSGAVGQESHGARAEVALEHYWAKLRILSRSS